MTHRSLKNVTRVHDFIIPELGRAVPYGVYDIADDVQVLPNTGALDRRKQIAVVRQLTDLAASAPGDPSRPPVACLAGIAPSAQFGFCEFAPKSASVLYGATHCSSYARSLRVTR